MVKKNIFTFLLLPVSWIYGIIVFIRNKCFDFGILKEKEFNIPIISVGNITVGGTGKTPHIEYLVRLLKDEYKIAVLSRGYKRKTHGFILADEFSDAETIGDEPYQVKRKFPEIMLAVDADRCNGIKRIMDSDKSIEIILLDDAFQHRYVKPGLSVLLIDFNRPISHDYLLPAGKLREPASGRNRADIILISKSPADMKGIDRRILVTDLNLKNLQYLYFTTVVQDMLLPVFSDSGSQDISHLIAVKPHVLIVSGIANPNGLKQFVINISSGIKEIQFPDHHAYTKKNISGIMREFEQLQGEEKILITTEKDAARLQKFSDFPGNLKNRMFYIPIKIEFLNDDAESFNKHIFNYVRNNKRNSILYQGKDEISA